MRTKMSLSLAALVLLLGLAQGQETPTPAPRPHSPFQHSGGGPNYRSTRFQHRGPGRRIDPQSETLTPTQETNINILNELYQRDLEQIRIRADTDPAGALRQYQLLQWQSNRLLNEILNSDR